MKKNIYELVIATKHNGQFNVLYSTRKKAENEQKKWYKNGCPFADDTIIYTVICERTLL